jgi:hypothetical protein
VAGYDGLICLLIDRIAELQPPTTSHRYPPEDLAVIGNQQPNACRTPPSSTMRSISSGML